MNIFNSKNSSYFLPVMGDNLENRPADGTNGNTKRKKHRQINSYNGSTEIEQEHIV